MKIAHGYCTNSAKEGFIWRSTNRDSFFSIPDCVDYRPAMANRKGGRYVVLKTLCVLFALFFNRLGIAQSTKFLIINEIQYGKEFLKFKDSMSTKLFTSYGSDSLGQRSRYGRFIYMKFDEFDFLLDTAGLTTWDSTKNCQLNIGFEKMYVSDSLVFKKTLLSRFKKQSLVVKFDNNCMRVGKWQVVRRRNEDDKGLKVISSSCR
jgi:hypothetical protein